MQPVSARFDDALRGTPEPVLRAELWRDGTRLTLPSGAPSLLVTGGTLTVDEASKTRRSVVLGVADDLTVDQVADLMSPTDTDLRLWAGVRHTEGDEELVPVGVFRVSEVSKPSARGPLEVRAKDHSGMLADARFVTPWLTPQGAGVVTQMAAMVQDVLPVPCLDLTGSARTLSQATWEKDRWDTIESLASSIGADPLFDPSGRFVIRPVPVLHAGASVWTIDSYTPKAVMLDVAVTWSTSRLYNAVVATSSNADTPVSAVAYQTSGRYRWRPRTANSPGFQRPRYYASPALSTVDQCLGAAQAILSRSLAASKTLALTCAPNPALDVGDQVDVLLPDGTREERIVSRIVLPLGLGPMSVDTRTSPDDGLGE